jgi:hypothetical protein
MDVAETPTLSQLAELIRSGHRKVLAAARTTLLDAKETGDCLIQAKAQVPHGEWSSWLGHECDLSSRVAQVYMQIARNWDRLEGRMNANFDSHLDDGGQYDITWARIYLANFRHDDDEGVDDGDDCDTDLNTGGCGGGGGPNTGTGQNPDDYPEILQLVLTRKKKREFRLSTDQRDLVLSLFKTRRSELVDALTSPAFAALLVRVSAYRNAWKGHGGIEGEAEALRRLTILETELTNFRELFANAFDGYLLLHPRASTFMSGTFEYTVRSLMGTRDIFRELKVPTTVPMDVTRLYWLDTESSVPLQLLPFFRMMKSPSGAENACYFLNRVEKDGIRWVSYHFEASQRKS